MAVAVEDVSAPPVGRDHPGYRLAAGTELIGEYQDSGLQTPKYPIRRAAGQGMQPPPPLQRPAGAELSAEYQDSGLQTPKYLIRRADGQVMQLPLLLYRVAGSLDGRDAGRIATELSAELGRELTPGQVAFLVEERLRPAGGVALDDGDAGGGRAAPPVESHV